MVLKNLILKKRIKLLAGVSKVGNIQVYDKRLVARGQQGKKKGLFDPLMIPLATSLKKKPFCPFPLILVVGKEGMF
jgi:hypothetical protein